jgi:hypothetical protein
MNSDGMEALLSRLPRFIQGRDGVKAFLQVNSSMYPGEWYAGYYVPEQEAMVANYFAMGTTPGEAVLKLAKDIDFYQRVGANWGGDNKSLDGSLSRE